jgi:hypothetical protein
MADNILSSTIDVRFARKTAAHVFSSTAEGIYCNLRDDAVISDSAARVELAAWEAFIGAVNLQLVKSVDIDLTESVTFTLPSAFAPLVERVRDSCANNAHDMGVDNEDDLEESDEAVAVCGDWEVTIVPSQPI